MMLNFSEIGHPVFRVSSTLERLALRSKGKGKLPVQFCGDDKTVEVVFRTIISVSQLSINGAAADMCEEPAWEIYSCPEGTGKLVAPNDSETMTMPAGL